MISTTQVIFGDLKSLLKCNLNDAPIFIFQSRLHGCITLNISVANFDKLCLNINQNHCAMHHLIDGKLLLNRFEAMIQARVEIIANPARKHRLKIAVTHYYVNWLNHMSTRIFNKSPFWSSSINFRCHVHNEPNKITALNTPPNSWLMVLIDIISLTTFKERPQSHLKSVVLSSALT